MNQLEENRAVINEVDEQMTKLFVRRFKAVEGIVSYKIEHEMPVLDRSREQALISAREQQLPDHLKPYFRSWYEGMLAVSRQYQTDIINHRNESL